MYPPQLPKLLLNVPIQTSTSPRATPKCSAMPRPVAPSTPIEWASSIISSVLVPPFHLHELRQIGDVAVHAVHALDGDQHAAILVPELVEQLVGRLRVVVGEKAGAGRRRERPLARCCCGPGRRAAPDRPVPAGARSPSRWWRGRRRRPPCLPYPGSGSTPAPTRRGPPSGRKPAGWPRRSCRPGRWPPWRPRVTAGSPDIPR